MLQERNSAAPGLLLPQSALRYGPGMSFSMTFCVVWICAGKNLRPDSAHLRRTAALAVYPSEHPAEDSSEHPPGPSSENLPENSPGHPPLCPEGSSPVCLRQPERCDFQPYPKQPSGCLPPLLHSWPLPGRLLPVPAGKGLSVSPFPEPPTRCRGSAIHPEHRSRGLSLLSSHSRCPWR